jgi:hypothetical protein
MTTVIATTASAMGKVLLIRDEVGTLLRMTRGFLIVG